MSSVSPARASGSNPKPAKPITANDVCGFGKQWDYLVVRIHTATSEGAITEQLQEIGQRRWELTGCSGDLFVFKRPLTN